MNEGAKTRRCGACRETKPTTEFAWRRKDIGQYDNLCRPCRADYHRQHYLANRQRYIDQARDQRQKLMLERTTWLLEYFASNHCADCDEADPLVLEFDHLRDKSFNIGASLTTRPWQVILDEIAKCEVVCANCHRRRTARRRKSVRSALIAAEGLD